MPKITSEDLELQAGLFGKYLIRQEPNEPAKKLYIKSVSASGLDIGRKDQKLLELILNHPSTIGLIDAGLIFYKPYSEIRRRLYVMLAILEASPDYHDKFLPKKRGYLYLFFVAYSGIRAIVKIVLGTIFVRLVAR